MKLGLISDVHGDPLALELAWAHLTTLAADQIICAGDVVGYGPFPDRVVAFLKEHAIDCVRGNHDRWALERGPGEPDEFGGGTPSAETLEFLERLPFYRLIADGPHIAVIVHGSPRGDMEFVTPRAIRRPSSGAGSGRSAPISWSSGTRTNRCGSVASRAWWLTPARLSRCPSCRPRGRSPSLTSRR